MKKTLLILLFLGTFVLNAAKLNVIVNNIQVEKGCVIVNIYNNNKDFIHKSIAAKRLKASNDCLCFTFDIADGIYAVSAYQDFNENRKLDKSVLNIPVEPYGLSNNFRPKFAVPSFNDCKFKVVQPTTISITLK